MQMTGNDISTIFDIQRFSLHDGPGLRTTVFFKGCGLRCLWCQNPESQSTSPEIIFYAEQCTGCFQCANACTTGALDGDDELKINRPLCCSCGKCADICPAGAIRLVGRKLTVKQLVEEILRDRDFFDESGGGVTLSGGEPMLQATFISDLCRALKEFGINIIMETAGHCKPDLYGMISGLVDEIYFDIKHSDDVEHTRLTGYGNGLVIESLLFLVDNYFHVQPRMPVIPGVNDSLSNIRNTAAIIKNAGLSSVHCLPYHNLGNSKLAGLRPDQKQFEAVIPSAKMLKGIASLFQKEGIDAVIYE
jgi:pyruvate formate lyase activating enzyme